MDKFIKINLPQKFSQNDPRWANSGLGFQGTIGVYGCLETDATMVDDYYGGNDTPLTLNEKLKKNGGYSDSQGNIGQGNLFVWGAFASLFSLKYSGQFSNGNSLSTAQMNQIKGAIDKGYPVFLQIDTVPATSGLDEHWILAIGYDGDDFIVQDPWDGGTKRITSWGVAAQKLIYAWCWFEGKVPTAPSEPQPDGTCLVPNTPAWQKTYQNLVGSATKWGEALGFLGITTKPEDTPSQVVANHVAGDKSRETDWNNRLTQEQKAHAESEAEVTNLSEQTSRLKAQVIQEQTINSSLSDQLKKASTSASELVKVYTGQLAEKQKQIDSFAKDKGTLQKQLASTQADLTSCRNGQPPTGIISKIVNYIKNLLSTLHK